MLTNLQWLRQITHSWVVCPDPNANLNIHLPQIINICAKLSFYYSKYDYEIRQYRFIFGNSEYRINLVYHCIDLKDSINT